MKLLVVSLLGLGSLGVIASSHNTSNNVPEPAFEPFADASVEVSLLRTGISPEALAAAGVPATSIPTVVADAVECTVTANDQLAPADADHAEARRNCEQLRRRVRSGLATSEEVTACQAAITAAESATAARDTLLMSLCSDALAALTPTQRQTVETILSNRGQAVPTEFLTVSRSEAAWKQLKNDLGHERTYTKHGFEHDQTILDRLAATRAEPSVATAKVNLDSTLASVRSYWDASFH